MTYTFVRYWTEESLEELTAAIEVIKDDFVERRPFISDEAAAAMSQRLKLLDLAVKMLLEPVPKPFGG